MFADATWQSGQSEPSRTTSCPFLQKWHPPTHQMGSLPATSGIDPQLATRQPGTHTVSLGLPLWPLQLQCHTNGAGHKPTLQKIWDYRTQDGYYIGPELQHYRCYCVIAKMSGATVISDAVKFCHHYLPVPTIALEDKLLHALHAINCSRWQTTTWPVDKQLVSIQMLRTILHSYKQAINHADGHSHGVGSPPGVGTPQIAHPSPGVVPLSTTTAHP